MKASVIVLSWNGMDYLQGCLDAVLAQDYPDVELIVVDNGSADGSPDFVEEQYPELRLIRNARNLGFAAGNNVGLRAATGDVLVLLNQDTVVKPGWLEALVTTLEDPTIGIVGCKLLYPDGTIQHAGGQIVDARGTPQHVGHGEPDVGQYDAVADVDYVTGAALGVSREALARIGQLDEGFAPAYYEDVDWCYRARKAGLRVAYCPNAVAVHYESTSSQVGTYTHHAVFHYVRLRFLLKHHPLDWLREEFAPAEVAALRAMSRTDEAMAVREACLRLLFDLPEVARIRAQGEGTAAEWGSLLSLVTQLRAACVPGDSDLSLRRRVDRIEERAVGTRVLEAALHRQGAGLQAETADADPSVESQSASLESTGHVPQRDWELSEPDPMSRLPLVAPLRQVWNDVAIRPYVLPMLQQQAHINQRIAVTQVEILHVLRDLLARMTSSEQDIAQSIREINTLSDLLARLLDSVDLDER
jgi:GT2 family glycosyltransferase